MLNWFLDLFGLFVKAKSTVNFISAKTVNFISAEISQEGIKCTKAKKELKAYCPNLYTVTGVQQCTENG